MKEQRKTTKNDRRAGFYWVGGRPYISVTNVLGDVLRKPGLEYWSKEQVYLAMAKDPTLDKAAALNAPADLANQAKDRGSTIHSIVEAWKQTHTYVETIPDAFRGYARAFYRFVKDQEVEILEHEKTVISENYGYGGTLDLLTQFKKSGRVYLVDAKTGKNIYPDFFLQLSAYRQALKEGGVEVDGMGVLLLKDDGTYAFELGEDCLSVFLAALHIWEWKNKDTIAALGVETKELPSLSDFSLSLRKYDFERLVEAVKKSGAVKAVKKSGVVKTVGRG